MKETIFAIPFAGGSSDSYLTCKVPEKYDLIILDLPGKGKRKKEPLIDDIHKMAKECEDMIFSILDDGQSYSLWGHSMGSFIAYEMTADLEEKGKRLPNKLVFTGTVSPDRADRSEIEAAMADRQSFLSYIVEFGLVNDTIAKSRLFQELYLPVIENDYRAMLNYIPSDRKIRSVKTLMLNGEDDIYTHDDIVAWSGYFETEPFFKWVPGKHFFIFDDFDSIFFTMDEMERQKK